MYYKYVSEQTADVNIELSGFKISCYATKPSINMSLCTWQL